MNLFVIVLYNCSLSYSISYNSITNSLLLHKKKGILFVWDNSPSSQVISNLSEGWSDIIYHHCPENLGLSCAYNYAAKYAQHKDIEWIMLLDQDTTFPINIIQEYESSILNNPEIKLFVPPVKVQSGKYLSPSRVTNHITRLSTKVPSGITNLWEYMPINSGMMVNVDAFLAVGGYNEKVRLDFSDYQFIERFRYRYNNFFVLQSVCFQEFSNEVHTTQQLTDRYKIFCDCIKNCSKTKFTDKYLYLLIVIKRALSLSIRTRNLKFIQILFKFYL